MVNSGMWNVAIVAQRGRIAYQALLCAASIRAHHSADDIRVYICVPNYTRRWKTDPGLDDVELVEAFRRYDCEITPFDNADFGSRYPHSNKFYAILSLPADEPFMFLDSDTIVAGSMRADIDFARPVLRPAQSTWPVKRRGSPSIGAIWRSLYDFFGLDPAPYFDAERGDKKHQCYPYYNAGLMYYERSGIFGSTMLQMAKRLWRKQPDALRRQPLNPWLDQIVLPLVLAKFGVPRIERRDLLYKPTLHYRVPALLLLESGRAFKVFDSLSRQPGLVSVLSHDPGFRYYLSEEGREVVQRTFDEVMQSRDSDSGRTPHKAFLRLLRSRTSLLR